MSIDRIPPHNLDAERCLLGACFIENDVVDRILDILTGPADFYMDKHQKLFGVILKLHNDGEPVDLLTVSNRCRPGGFLDALGGPHFLTELFDAVPTTAHVEHYARIVRDDAIRRRVIQEAHVLLGKAYDKDTPIETGVQKSTQKLAEISEAREVTDMRPKQEWLHDYLSKLEVGPLCRNNGAVTTGFAELDRRLGAIEKRKLIYVAARPGMGKSCFLAIVGDHIAEHFGPVCYFTNELPGETTMTRLSARYSGVESNVMRFGPATRLSEELPKIAEAIAKHAKFPLYLSDKTLSVAEMGRRCRKVVIDEGRPLSAIFLDRIELVSDISYKDYRTELMMVSRALKRLAEDFDCPVFTVCQLNRDCEKRFDKRPTMADVRDSGALEQDAQIMLALYREEYYDRGNSDVEGKSEVIILKCNDGDQQSSAELYFRKKIPAFYNLAGV